VKMRLARYFNATDRFSLTRHKRFYAAMGHQRHFIRGSCRLRQGTPPRTPNGRVRPYRRPVPFSTTRRVGKNCVLQWLTVHSERIPLLKSWCRVVPGTPAHEAWKSIYEYGSRAGVWRILKEFETTCLPADGLWWVGHGTGTAS